MTDLKIIQKDPENEKELEDALPTPVGYRVLVALPEVEETFGKAALLSLAKSNT